MNSRFLLFFLCLLSFAACKKNPVISPKDTKGLSYGDSVFYIRNQSYVINPVSPGVGTYTAFPDNLLIDNTTGQITVDIIGKGFESQTGMKYKIMFREAGTDKLDSTYITLSGINYLDKIYYLSQHDTIISPIYNASFNKNLPSGTYGIQADNDLAINAVNGQINIKECIRRGLFKTPAENGEWEELTIQYKTNDNSNNATNSIDVAIYYYNRITDVPRNITPIMRAHQTMMLGLSQPEIPLTVGPTENDLPDNISISRPRPPCIIIIAN
jgi:hypothetical protein